MKIVYGTQFQNYIATGVALTDTLAKVKTHYCDGLREDIAYLYAMKANELINRDFGVENASVAIEEISEEIANVQAVEVQIRQAKTIAALEKLLIAQIDEEIVIRKIG